MTRLERYSDNSRYLGPETCECGRRKTRYSDACERCRFLDGEHAAVAQIVSLLREYNGMSTAELAAATKRWDVAVLRSLQRMIKSGRVRRYWRESEGKDIIGRGKNGYAQRHRLANRGHWAYALDGDWERQP